MATIDDRSGCKFPRCRNRADFAGYCSDHKKESSFRHKEYNRTTRNKLKQKVYSSRRWQKLRVQVLQIQPLCSRCLGLGKYVSADMVDHIVGFVDENDEHAWEIKYLYPLCNRCHRVVTEMEKTVDFLTMPLYEAVFLKYGLDEPRKEHTNILL